MKKVFLLFTLVGALCVQSLSAQSLKGDMNDDRVLDVTDVNALVAVILGLTPDTHEYVDLGLPGGVLWATCNIGASSPENYGLYFAWGETVGYANGESHCFNLANYKWCNGSYYSMTKYCSSSTFGTVDNKTVLDFEDDAATVNWGPNWRMPTLQEIKDLFNGEYTTTEWASINGVYGYKITSKSNGNSIFLPATGYRGALHCNSVNDDTEGYYWSKWVHASTEAYVLYFNSGNIDWSYSDRYFGQTIRPVRVPSEQNNHD